MACSDSTRDPNPGTTIATVAVIQVGLGFAILSGFPARHRRRGHVTDREVTSSSRAEELDRAACAAWRKCAGFQGRGRCEPPACVASTFESTIVWRLPGRSPACR